MRVIVQRARAASVAQGAMQAQPFEPCRRATYAARKISRVSAAIRDRLRRYSRMNTIIRPTEIAFKGGQDWLPVIGDQQVTARLAQRQLGALKHALPD